MIQDLIEDLQYQKAILELERLQNRFGLMPTETFALAYCQAATGDTSSASLSYIICLEQHGVLVWFYLKPPPLINASDSMWYNRVVHCAERYRMAHPEYIDGATGILPTVLTRINRVHQSYLDSIAEKASGDELTTDSYNEYDAIQRQHDAVLDSMIQGKMPVFSVGVYGVNTELQTFLLHVSPEFMTARGKHIYKWLRKGLIYPDDYAACVDGPAYRLQRPMIFKFYRSSDNTGVSADYERNRWKIGMGNDKLNGLRFLRYI
jgi:hypothetical protein